MHMHTYMHAHAHAHARYKSLQVGVVTKPLTFADACTHPSAKRITVYGRTGPVNAVEADGTLFIENDEAKALCSKALGLVSEVAVASEVAAMASDVVLAPRPTPEHAAALDSEPFCSVETSSAPAVYRISYSAAASKPPVRPKPSVAVFEPRPVAAPKLSAGLERSQPAVVLAPLEVSICIMSIHIYICRCSMHIFMLRCTCMRITCACALSTHAHACACACACTKRANMPGCTHCDLCVSRPSHCIHRTSRWTILPSPSAPPCRSTSPESKETRFEHTIPHS